MSVRPPSCIGTASVSDVLFDALGHEILAEKASALGRAGDKAQACLARLKAHAGEAADGHAAAGAGEAADGHAAAGHDSRRKALLQEAADAVHAFFIQRELCGLSRHDAAIGELGVPREVLARLGAK